jgi:AraC family transcriptional regulator, regulatory protein of adaptative response / methylated-DNA-[protein]-cysteine methyltransferase
MRQSKIRVALDSPQRKVISMNTPSAAATLADTTNESFVTGRDFDRVARAIDFIEKNYSSQPRLADIAASAHLSEFHFSRLFTRWAGVTPKQYLAWVTAHAAKLALREERSVMDAAHLVGLSGTSRLHDLTVTFEALTPGEIRADGRSVVIRFGTADSPFGSTFIAQTARGLCRLGFVDTDGEAQEREALERAWPEATFVRDDAQAQQMAQQIWSESAPRTRSRRPNKPLALTVRGTNFHVQVWRALLELGANELTTYGDLAAKLGVPKAARAIGTAVGANPIGFIIPCHRVLRAGGALGGYRWGLARKQAVLSWERMQLARASG